MRKKRPRKRTHRLETKKSWLIWGCMKTCSPSHGQNFPIDALVLGSLWQQFDYICSWKVRWLGPTSSSMKHNIRFCSWKVQSLGPTSSTIKHKCKNVAELLYRKTLCTHYISIVVHKQCTNVLYQDPCVCTHFSYYCSETCIMFQHHTNTSSLLEWICWSCPSTLPTVGGNTTPSPVHNLHLIFDRLFWCVALPTSFLGNRFQLWTGIASKA